MMFSLMERDIIRNSTESLTDQVYHLLKNKILSGELESGEKIPPGIDLSKKLHLAYKTVEKAYARLLTEGLVMRMRGKGTFVKARANRAKPKGNRGKVIYLQLNKYKIGYPFTERIYRYLKNRLESENYELELTSVEDYEAKGQCWWQALPDSADLKGVIIDKEGIITVETLKFMASCSLPKIITLSSPGMQFQDIPTILPDYGKGAYLAVNLLLGLGHQRIALVLRSERQRLYQSDGRKLRGCQMAFNLHDLELDDALIFEGAFNNPDRINKIFTEIAALTPKVTAALCADDIIAFHGINALAAKGIKVPDAFSVIGFNNFDIALLQHPYITTIEVNIERIATLIADNLITLINNGGTVFHEKILEVQLLERESCSICPKN